MSYQPGQNEALDLRGYLRPVWRHKWIVLAITVVAAAGTYFISSREAKSYTTTTTVYVLDAEPTVDLLSPGSNGTPSPTELANVAQLMTAGSIGGAVAQQLGPSVAASGSVSATPSTTSSFITVTGTSSSPVDAARLANAYVRVFLNSIKQTVAADAQRQVRVSQTALNAVPKGGAYAYQRQQLEAQISAYQQAVLNPADGAQQTNTAAVPGVPTSPRPKSDAIFGGIVGLVLGIILAFGLELLDRTLISVGTVESMFRRPILAVLPHVSDPTPLVEGDRPVVPGEFVEALRSLTVVLRLSADSDPPRTIMVTSTLAGEGKSTVTRDLALVYAESAGKRVLVIDGDVRLPSMSRLFGFEAEKGLIHVLRGEASLAEAAVPVVGPAHAYGSENGHGATHTNGNASAATNDLGLEMGSVDVLAHGEILDNPLPLMASERMPALLAEAREAYDIVLMDTPPVLAVADAVPLLERFDSVLLVARLSRTTRHAAREFRQLVTRLAGVNFTGVIANDRKEDFDDGYSAYYRYGYKYYRGDSGSGSSYGYSSRYGKRRSEPKAAITKKGQSVDETDEASE